MDSSRREMMTMMTLVGGTAALVPSAVVGSAVPVASSMAQDGRLTVNRERAARLMKEAGVDAIVGGFDDNARYLTNMRSVLSDMGMRHRIIGIMAADLNRPVTAVMPSLDIARHMTPGREWPELITYSAPVDGDRFVGMAALPLSGTIDAIPQRQWPRTSNGALTPTEQAWEAAVSKRPAANAATLELGILKALGELGVTKGVLAVDDPALADMLVRAGIDPNRIVAGNNMFLHIRLAKSAVEIERMRIVSDLNDAASRAMIANLTPGMTMADVEAAFFAEVVRRGGRPEFVVAGMTSGLRHGRLVKHEPFLVDCCGNFDGYSGDFARTVVLGAPPKLLIDRSKLLGRIAAEMTSILKPGVKYSEITARGRDMARKMGADFPIGFGPHSVGLAHSEDPRRDDVPFEARLDVTLQPGMVITVDLPTLEPGWGSMHLENLILITVDGAKWLGRFDDPLYELRI